MYDSRPFLAA